MPLNGDAPAIATTDVEHPPPWGWRVSSYFLSKGIAAGAMMLAPLLLVLGARGSALADVAPGLLALAGIAVTGIFLVWDLKQPRRFYYLFTKPQWRSWLTRGAQVINVAVALALAFTLAAIFGWHGLRDGLALDAYTGRGAAGGLHGVPVQPVRGARSVAEPDAAPAHDRQRVHRGRGGARNRRDLLVSPHDAAARAGLDARARRRCERRRDRRSTRSGATPRGQAERAARNLYRDRFATRFWLGGVLLGLAAPAALGCAYLWPRAASACWLRRARARWRVCGSTRTLGYAQARACP